jgi:biotin carboxylase
MLLTSATVSIVRESTGPSIAEHPTTRYVSLAMTSTASSESSAVPSPVPDAGSERPRLVVVYGHRSLDALQIREGARDWCDIIWLVDADDPAATAVAPLLRRSGPVVDVLAASPEAAAAALAPHRPDGLVTFYDSGMEHVAEIAARLGLRFHSPQTGRALEDKYFQREALRAAGLPTPRAARIPVGSDVDAVLALADGVGYPAVLKPRRASGSWQTFAVADADELDARWRELPAGASEEMLLEQFLADGPPLPGGFEAGYVSVETVVGSEGMTHLAITGRFPPVPPFRETGFFMPSTVPASMQEELLALAGDALRAVGFVAGTAHTELKLTPEGPRVLEINGRVGGGIPDMLLLTTGVDIIAATMRASLGVPVGLKPMPPHTGVAYRFFYQPPPTARRVDAIEGLDRLGKLPGMQSVLLHHPPGTELDSRHGTRTYLFAAIGLADDHAGVRSVDQFLRTEITTVYS